MQSLGVRCLNSSILRDNFPGYDIAQLMGLSLRCCRSEATIPSYQAIRWDPAEGPHRFLDKG